MNTSLVKQFLNIYQGPKLSVLITGGGISFTDILKYPGGSDIIESVDIPYGYDSALGFLQKYYDPDHNYDKIKWCSVETTKAYLEALAKRDAHKNVAFLVINASLTTWRYRKGNNQAYIGVAMPIKKAIYSVILPKLPEDTHNHCTNSLMGVVKQCVAAKRYDEDQLIAQYAMSYLSAGGVEPPYIYDSHVEYI